MGNNLFKYDLYRYYGETGETILQRLFRPPQIRYLYNFRKASVCKSSLLELYYRIKLQLLSQRTGIQIPINTSIGEGFYIGHYGTIIVNQKSVLGKNINIAPGVTIGQENRGKRKGTPVIGDFCWIGMNSVIVGNIKVGNNVLIAPLTFVNFDVPDNSIVVGNPGRIISREDATKDYINTTV